MQLLLSAHEAVDETVLASGVPNGLIVQTKNIYDPCMIHQLWNWNIFFKKKKERKKGENLIPLATGCRELYLIRR